MNKYYSNKEHILRQIWNIVCPLFFRYSPRLLYSWRNLVLSIMGAKIGKNVQIYPSAIITYPWLLEIGDGSVIAWNVRIYNLGVIKIGQNTIISQHAHLCGGTHDTSKPGFILQRTGLMIGNNVWIASDAFIGPRVTVGDNSIVAARSVVTKDVEPFTIVGGNPASVIKRRNNIL